MRRKNPPLLKFCQPRRSQRISEAASQSAHASMKKRYHQIEIEQRPGRGRRFSLRAWNQRSTVLVEPLPVMNISGLPSRPSPTAVSRMPSALAVRMMRKTCSVL